MEEEDSASGGLYKPHMEAESQSFDVTVQTVELPNVDECEPIHEIDDSQLLGAPAVVAGDAVVCADVETKTEMEVKERGDGKRKRGRPPRGLVKPPPSKKKEEEDVCFICFDGGSLVLCDRRGCPKAYHPACIKRDEAFFRSKARWNCGWHICSSCQKAAHYMCYTCTYSLCKGCTKDADYLCVRGNKGFCTICMRTIMLIENNEQGNKETALVDFDDKSSWEYLFKVYWIYLKGKLSLTLSELTQAKNPWKRVGTMPYRGLSSDVHYGANDGKSSISDSSFRCLEANISKRRKTTEHPELLNQDSVNTEKSGSDKSTTSIGCTEWASKELLEFVAHMRNGDISVLSQFDVQALLLDYIKRNNLRDPRRKSQIICDLRLKNLFGKQRVGHFEMLKLLEFHFLIKEESQKDVIIQGNIVDAVVSQVEADGNNDDLPMMGKDKRRKTRRKGEERGPQTNLNEYAAIDAHNINLIYLRRSLMENLIEDDEKFHDKVVGSIVRIRISGSDQKQDMYRLVQVVGTSKVDVPSKTGKRTADVMLEILNLDKKEAIAIDAISNQEFSEDECRRLRQSIKCGLVKRLTVGDIQEKAMALQAVRLNDWLETEILRLNHLRDRASEKGHKKELRECVEKSQLLKTPEERQRRLHEIPEVLADSHMDPNYESEEDAGELNDKKQDGYVKPRYTGFSRNVRESISPHKEGDISNDASGRGWKNLTNCEQSEGNGACGSISLEKAVNHVDSRSSVIGGWDNQAVVMSGSFSGVASETSTAPFSTGMEPSANDSETDKLWHYQDPNGKIQGPFSMVQLRKWSTTGYFPPDMKIWSIDDKQDDSLLLTDALKGQFHNSLPSLHNISLLLQNVGGVSDSRLYTCDGRSSGNVDTTGIDGKQKEGGWNCNNARAHSFGNNEFVRSNGLGSHSSDWTTPVINYNDVQAGSFSQCWDSFKGNNSCSDQPLVHSPLPSSEFSGHPYGTLSHDGRGHEDERWNSGPNHGNRSGQSHDMRPNTQSHSDQSSGQNWRPLSVNFSSKNCSSSSDFASVAKSTDSPEQNREIDVPNPIPMPKTSIGDWEAQAAENKQSVSSNIPVEDSHISDLPSPTPKPSDGDEKGQDAENKQPVSSKFPVQDSGHSWSSASSLVVGSGAQLREIADERSGYSPTAAKPSVEEWDSGLVSLSSLKPPEAANDHAVSSNIPVDDSYISDLPSPTPKPSDGDEKGQAAENKQSVSSNFPVQDSGPSWSSASSLVVGSGAQATQLPEIADDLGGYSRTPAKPSVEEWDSSLVAENKQSLSSNFPVQDSGPSWSSASSLVVGSGAQLPEIADEQGGYSPTPAKPSVESGLVSVSSLKPPEAANDHAVSSNIAVEDSHISDMPSPTPEPSDGDEKGQDAENKQSLSSNYPVQDSAPNWSSASSLVVGSGAQLPEIADERGGYSPTPAKPSVEEWDSGLVSVSSLKPPEAANDHAANPTSKSDQLTHSPPSHPAFNASSWQAIVTEPIEFSTLAEESVSDLLAEVDAMESQGGLASPTSVMNCGGDLIQGSKDDCFSSIEGLSPTPDPGKSDALSSTGEVQFPSQSTMADEPLEASQADILDPIKRSTWKSSTSAGVEGETKPSDPINHWGAGLNIPPPAPSTTSQEMIDKGTSQRAGSEAMDTGRRTVQGNLNSGWGGIAQGITNMGRGTGQGTARGNASMNRGSSVGSIGWESQPKYSGERFTGPRGSALAFQSGNSGFGRGRSSWSWQSSFGGSGGYSRHPPKGQRVCKFYESGHCKKGASCDYLHP